MLRVKIKQEVLPLIKNLWQAAKIGWRIDRRNLVLYGVTMIMQVASSIGATYFGAQVLNELFRVLSANVSTSALYRNFLLSAVLLIVEQVAWRLMSYYQNSSFIVWHTQLAPEFHGKLASLDIGRFEDSKYSKLINKVSQDYAWRPSNFMYHGLNTIHGVMRLIGTAAALFAFSPLIVLILLVVVLPSLIVESRQSKVKWNIWNVKGDASRRYHKTTWMMQNKQDIMDMRVFGLVDYLIDFTRRMLDDFNQDQQKALKRFIRPAVIARIIEGSIIGGINFWLIHRVISGVYDVGQYSFYSGMVNQFNNAIGIVLSSTGTLYEYNLYMTDYFTFMQTPPLLHKTDSPKKVGGSVPEIIFENVSFSYPHTDKPVFRNLNLTIQPGESIALVGENGAGKSTLIKLLLRFYDVDKGAICVDGINIKELDIDSWYKHVSALMQDFSRYPFPIKDNIHFGRIKKPLDKNQLKAATKLGGVDKFVNEYEQGLDTMLDPSFDDGVEPSGGQWQRVALARAFYRNANVLILDEPTAAIDANAEYEIFKNITQSQKDKTTIIVSHRFSTVRTADHIYVLEHGQITEHGSHKELMKHSGEYARMFNKQAEGYK